MEKTNSTQLASYFDYTLLRADACQREIKQFCNNAIKYQFKMVAINSVQTALCHELLRESNVHVGAAIGFPLGQTTIEVKKFETAQAIRDGADEIDYVIHIGKLKDKAYSYIQEEMQQIVAICKDQGVISKVIFENCYLTDDEKKKLCEVALKVKPDFIKTSTGFGKSGAAIQDVLLMKQEVGDAIKVKASGGIRTLESVFEFLEAGVNRIGLSTGIEIIDQYVLQCKEKNEVHIYEEGNH